MNEPIMVMEMIAFPSARGVLRGLSVVLVGAP